MKIFLFALLLSFILIGCQNHAVIKPYSAIISNKNDSSEQETNTTNSTTENKFLEKSSEITNPEGIDITKDYSNYFVDGVTLEFIPYPQSSYTTDKKIISRTVNWINNKYLFVINFYENTIEVCVLDSENQDTTYYSFNIPKFDIQSTRVVGEKLLLTTNEGFLTIDTGGKLESLFIYEDEKNHYVLPERSQFVDPVINDDLHFIAYSTSDISNYGFSDIILIDQKAQRQYTIYSKIQEDGIGRYPVAFSINSEYLYFYSKNYEGLSDSYFGGSIHLETSQIAEPDTSGLNRIQRINLDGSILLFNRLPPN